MRTNLLRVLDLLAAIGHQIVGFALALLVVPTALLAAAHPGTTDLTPRMSLTAVETTVTDVLPTAFHDAPADLWNALIDQYPGAYDDDVPGIGTFYIPIGSVVETDTATYFATLDGWGQIIKERPNDVVVVEMLDIPSRTAASVYAYRTNGTAAQCGTDAQCAALTDDRNIATLGWFTEGATQTQSDLELGA